VLRWTLVCMRSQCNPRSRTFWHHRLGEIADRGGRHLPALLNLLGEHGEVLGHGLDALGASGGDIEIGEGRCGIDGGGAEHRKEDRGKLHLDR
jgi:hypothetical protein